MNISSTLDKNRNFILYSLVITLFTISSYIVHVFSPELSKLYGYTESNTMLIKQLIPIAVGVVVAYLLGKLNRDIWFDRVGLAILFISFSLSVIIPFFPAFMISEMSNVKKYISIGGISINPMLYFPIGALWLISWSQEHKSRLFTNFTILVLMLITSLVCVVLKNMGLLILLETLFITLLVYLNGINKFTILSAVATLGAGVLFIFMAEHRIIRIISWWNTLSGYVTNLSIEESLHENILLSLIQESGHITLFTVILLFIAIAYLLLTKHYEEQKYKLFIFGFVSLVLIDLILNILYTYGLLPIYPTSLYMFGYGTSSVISSFIFLGIVRMVFKSEK